MFERTIISRLREWAGEKDRKPLVLRGARQVGKTTLVNLFSGEFDQFISMNLEKATDKHLFEEDQPFSQLVDAIFFINNTEKNKGKTLIFIDEIQNSPAAVAKMRYFYEECKDLYVIAAGSLLESLIDSTITFPVGRVDFLPIRPCSFEEFLIACGEVKSHEILLTLQIPAYAHEKLADLFKLYTVIGGMPEILNEYAESKDLQRLQRIYNRLIVSLQDDVEKYARNQTMHKVIRHVIGYAFQYAGKRITFEKFGGSVFRSREMGEAFKTLEKAFLLHLVYPVTSTRLPMEEKLRKSPKLIMLDTGLVNYSAGIQKELFSSKIIDEDYYGNIAEQIIGQELIAQTASIRSTLNFWTREERTAQAEVDFVYPYLDMLIPIEVKSGSSGRLRSLHQFVDRAPHIWAIRFYSGKMKVEDARTSSGKNYKLINLPFYLVGKISRVLDGIIVR
jgi:predicted AAA+ superfamily ATPase